MTETPASITPRALRTSLRATAERVLEAMLNTRRRQSSALRLFPEQTRPAALLLARHLNAGGTAAQLLQTQTGHTWVRAGRYHLDLSRSESTYNTVLYVRTILPPGVRGQIVVQTAAQASLELPDVVAEEVLLRPYLDAPRGKQPLTPRVPVVDHWLGMDVLACGHLLTAKRSSARYCPYCPPLALPSSMYRVTAREETLRWFREMSDEERGALVEQMRAVKGDPAPGG